ncbi:MAG TPA: hypothetical protein VIW01_04565 [Dehalococcoidia bacterium]
MKISSMIGAPMNMSSRKPPDPISAMTAPPIPSAPPVSARRMTATCASGVACLGGGSAGTAPMPSA